MKSVDREYQVNVISDFKKFGFLAEEPAIELGSS